MDQLKPSSGNSTPLTPLDFLERASVIYGDCPSIIYNNTTQTWSQTNQRCLRLASSIASLGIQSGQVVSVVAPNIPAMYELHFAIPMAGSVLNTINLRLDARTISVILQHSESKLVFVDDQSSSVVLEALSLFPGNFKKPDLVLITDDGKSLKSNFLEFCRTYEEMVENGDQEFDWIRPKSEFDPFTLNYTSGTTSAPKGVVHCHRSAYIMAIDSLVEWSVPKQPVYLWTLPMFHANGWSFTWGMAVVGGANVCLRKFDANLVYSLIDKHKITHMCGAPVVLNMLCNSPDEKRLSHPVSILAAGAPPPAAVLHRTESLGFNVTHGYGLTETGGLSVCCTWKQKWNKFPASERARLKARQGVRTNTLVKVDVLDSETGESVKKDGLTLGEIVLRGGCVMLGYLKDPEATSKCLKDGWFYTGDVGVMHPDGYVEIKDRSKDVIISGGENLSSIEVESVLYMHPGVIEAAVVARPDEFWGETPCAFVSLKDHVKGKVEEKEIVEFCKAKLPKYMVPKTVVFKEELPKTSTGKIQKFVLRDMAKAMGASRVSRL
ncbi:ligase [Lithospermum erythrorhizon]|uniref:Ligase n=1 Tax=Lithospermum erythrorhizon TaxID=34254 RepID=A0AAV3P3D7_LITER